MKNKICIFSAILLLAVGCMSPELTKTARTGTEQLILSQAADRATSRIVFEDIKDMRVFVDDSKFNGVDKEYPTAMIRHKVLLAGGLLTDDATKAQIIIEITSGGIGTDQDATIVGLPSMPIPIPTTNSTLVTPELSLFSTHVQTASCKLNLNVRDAITGKMVSLHPRLYGNAYADRWSVIMIFEWTSTSLGDDERNFPGGKDDFVHTDPTYKNTIDRVFKTEQEPEKVVEEKQTEDIVH